MVSQQSAFIATSWYVCENTRGSPNTQETKNTHCDVLGVTDGSGCQVGI